MKSWNVAIACLVGCSFFLFPLSGSGSHAVESTESKASPSNIVYVKTMAEYEAQTKKKGKVMVDFFATWCGPCKMLAPHLVTLAEEQPELTIVKVDGDQAPELTQSLGVRAYPTLLFYEDGEFVHYTSGYMDVEGLKKFVQKPAKKS